MAKSSNNLKAVLQDTATAIKNKAGTSSLIEPRDFADNISAITKITYTPQESSDLIKQLYSGTVVNAQVPDGVSTLHPYLFYQMTSLQSVDFNEVATIPADCCYGCSNLTSVEFSTSTTRIEDYAFYSCTKIDNLSLPHTLTNIGQYVFYNVGNYYSQGTHTFTMIDNVGIHTTIGQYAFYQSHLSEIDAYTNNIGNYAFSYCQSLTDVSLEIHGSVGENAFYNCTYVENFEINANSIITFLGNNAFNGLASNSYATATINPFDFRNSTFTSLPSGVWSSCYFDGVVYFPSTLATISGNFLNGAKGNWTLYFNSVPTVSNSSYLRNDQSGFTVKYCFLYELLDTASSATNWSSHTSQMIGYGTGYAVGTTLPEYARTSGVALSWFTDIAMTTPITVSTSATDVYYCSLGSTRVVWFVDTPTLIDGSITISDGTNTYSAGDAIPVNTSITITPNYTDNTKTVLYMLTVNGVDYTSAGTATITMTQDLAITVIYWDGVNPPILPNFADNSPTLIATAFDSGNIPATWNVGDYIDITLTNGNTARVMLVHKTSATSNYTYNDDNTTCPFILSVMNFVGDNHAMNSDGSNAGGWNGSEMRTYVNSSAFLDLFPSDWKSCLAMLKVKAMNGGNQSGTTLVESADKMFLFAEKEYYGAVQYSSATEGNALNQLDYYANLGVSLSNYSALRKGAIPTTTSYSYYWERSTRASSTYYFCVVSYGGNADYYSAGSTSGVVVGFSLSLSHTS